MGKVCTTCGIDIDDPKLPDDEPEQCDDCAEGSDNPEVSDDFSDDWD